MQWTNWWKGYQCSVKSPHSRIQKIYPVVSLINFFLTNSLNSICIEFGKWHHNEFVLIKLSEIATFFCPFLPHRWATYTYTLTFNCCKTSYIFRSVPRCVKLYFGQLSLSIWEHKTASCMNVICKCTLKQTWH